MSVQTSCVTHFLTLGKACSQFGTHTHTPNRASSCELHVTNPGEQLWNMHQWRAKGNIIYILQHEISRLASSKPQGDSSVCLCLCLCLYIKLHMSLHIFGVVAQLLISATILTCYHEPSAWTPGCAPLQLLQMPVWQDLQLSHRQHIHSSLSSWPQMINQDTVPLNCQSLFKVFAFPRDGN